MAGEIDYKDTMTSKFEGDADSQKVRHLRTQPQNSEMHSCKFSETFFGFKLLYMEE